MADDTRDIAISTRQDVKNLTEKVDHLTGLVEGMHNDLVERRGVEKAAKWVVSAAGGAAGGLTVIAAKMAGFSFPE